MKRPRLWREITAVLAIKVVLLACLFFAFFSPSHRTVVNRAAVSDRLLGADHR
jgi:hypothetical protein